MLAQNFKTPADLEIASEEFDALVRVLGMLERGELQHISEIEINDQSGGDWFNMSTLGKDLKCGTAGCIAGWARAVSKNAVFPWATTDNRLAVPSLRGPLYHLFFPNTNLACYDNITPAQAAIALRSYLTQGEPRWAEALSA